MLASNSKAAPKAQLWAFWQQSNEANQQTINHRPWQTLLNNYLSTDASGLNRFAYAKVTKEDRQRLQNYLQDLANTPIRSYAKAEQMAYWINLYNALTVEVILRHYPVQTILDIDTSPGFFANGPWGEKLLTIEGKEITLNDIEHRILRPIWNDNRIHYAVNCASYSCPNLHQDAFSAATTEAILDSAARAYVNNPRGMSIAGDEATLSSIFKWYADDFGDTEEDLIDHLKQYANDSNRAKLAKVDDLRYDYNWALNE